MFFIGIDLSGPSNTKDTAFVCFQEQADILKLVYAQENVSDPEIYDLIMKYHSQAAVTLGIDAPLSYNVGGGDRPGDKKLRKRIVQMGMHPGSVMPPTMTRMVYLTMRGISLAHILRGINPQNITVVETHPGAVMALHGAPVEKVVRLKSGQTIQNDLLAWLELQGLHGLSTLQNSGDHLVAACASALGAWCYQKGGAKWLEPANPPFHPFDFAC